MDDTAYGTIAVSHGTTTSEYLDPLDLRHGYRGQVRTGQVIGIETDTVNHDKHVVCSAFAKTTHANSCVFIVTEVTDQIQVCFTTE